MLKVAVIQLFASEDKSKNILKSISLVKEAARQKARFILLPEVFTFRGGLCERWSDVVEKIPGEGTRPLMEIARRHRVFILAGSVYEKSSQRNRAYNTSVLINDKGNIVAKYRKTHLFNATIGSKRICESDHFVAGHKNILSGIDDYRVGLSVCYDLRFPEFFRYYGEKGADILCVPSAFTYQTGQAHWEVLLRARAIENLCYVLAPNQIGTDAKGVANYGNSMIVDPWGKILVRASTHKEEVIYAHLDKRIIKKRRMILPGFGRC